jgi:hypothetical protein
MLLHGWPFVLARQKLKFWPCTGWQTPLQQSPGTVQTLLPQPGEVAQIPPLQLLPDPQALPSAIGTHWLF